MPGFSPLLRIEQEGLEAWMPGFSSLLWKMSGVHGMKVGGWEPRCLGFFLILVRSVRIEQGGLGARMPEFHAQLNRISQAGEDWWGQEPQRGSAGGAFPGRQAGQGVLCWGSTFSSTLGICSHHCPHLRQGSEVGITSIYDLPCVSAPLPLPSTPPCSQ